MNGLPASSVTAAAAGPLRAYTKNGTVIRIETDNTVKDGCRVRQLRACLKGRDMRERLYSPDRLKYPMKRVGERGEGRFERIFS